MRVVTDNNTLRINVTSTPGDPPAMFTWIRHQGEPLVNDSRITVNSSSGDLVVEDVQPSDRGVYEVTASNNAGNESIAVNVTVDCELITHRGMGLMRLHCNAHYVLLHCNAHHVLLHCNAHYGLLHCNHHSGVARI